MREYIFHPDRFGILALFGLSLVVIPVASIAGASQLMLKIVFGVIIAISFGGLAWLTILEARGVLPGQRHDRGRNGQPRSDGP